jgi:hypothetical protein
VIFSLIYPCSKKFDGDPRMTDKSTLIAGRSMAVELAANRAVV